MFKNKVVWITGASSGIGQALANEFAQQGARLILSGRQEAALSNVSHDCQKAGLPLANIKLLSFDVTDEAALPKMVEQAYGYWGSIDMLINNAGISQRSLVLDTEMETYRKLFEVDVFAQIALTKAVLPHMIESGSGHIVITSSVAGKLGAPLRTGYCAAKHAVMGFFDALRVEMAHQNIRVTTITPGFIRTNISANALNGDGSTFGKVDEYIAGGMEVNDCARVIMRGFKQGKQEIAVGKGIEMQMLKMKRYLPNLFLKIMNKQYEKALKSIDVD